MSDSIPVTATCTKKPRPKKVRRLPRWATDAKGLAAVLDGSRRWISTMDSLGKLPRPFRLGGRVLWNLLEIRDWLHAGSPDRTAWEAMKATVQTNKK